LEYAYEKGAFTMIETELISKSLAVLNSEISKKIIE
jgi:hypothetical protein